MPTPSPTDIALSRLHHKAAFFLTPVPATVLWSAQVAGAHSREAVSIAFDNGSGSNFGAITAGMELWIGTDAGDYDVERVRIKSVSSGDGGVTGTFTLAENSIIWADNQHLTAIGWFLLKPRRPRLGPDGTVYKDGGPTTGGITYSDQNTNTPPVTIAGENRASFLDEVTGEWVIESQLPSSYATASGASISSYGASMVYGPAAPAISINSGTGVGTVTFDTPGLYWIAWSCTDSNGKSRTTYRYYYAHSRDPQSGHYPFTVGDRGNDFSISNIHFDNSGWSAGISARNANLNAVPDFAPIIVWAENWYGATKKNLTFLPDESTTVVVGYLRRDRHQQDVERGVPEVSLGITTINGVADGQYNFSVSLEAKQTVDAWWKYPSTINPASGVHHFLEWHTTMLQVADVFNLTAALPGDSHIEFVDGNIFDRAKQALAIARARLVCDPGGRVHLVEDTQLLRDSDRTGLTTIMEIEDIDRNGNVDFGERQFEKQIPFLYLMAFDYDGGFDAEGDPAVEARCAIAPGNTPHESGAQPATETRQVVFDQTHANQLAGRYLAARNNEFPQITVPMVGKLGWLHPNLNEFWEITIATGDTGRGLSRSLRLILRSITATVNVQEGTVACQATFEAEANGPEGIAQACPGFPDLPEQDFDFPDDESEFPGGLMTASSIQYLPPQTKAWEERSAESVLDAYADPHWRIKQDSIASKDAIIWRCGTGYIKRSTDAGQNWSDVTPGSLPAGIAFIRGEGNYLVDEEHVFVGVWEDTGEWFSRIYYTGDDGATWAEQDVAGGSGAVTVHTNSTAAGHANSRSLVELSADRILVAHLLGTGPRIELIDTNSLTVLDSLDRASTETAISVARLSDTRFVVAYHDFDANNMWVHVFDVVADVITDRASAIVESITGVTYTAIETASATEFLVAYNGANGCVAACEYDPSGTPSITAGTPEMFNSGSTPYFAMCPAASGVSNTFNIVYAEATSAIKCVNIESTGSTITGVGTPATFASVQAKFISCAQLTGDKLVACYADTSDSDNGYAVVATVSSGSNTVGTPVEFKAAALTATSTTAESDTAAYVAYRHTTNSLAYKPLAISGHAVTPGSEVAFPESGAYPIILFATVGLVYGYVDGTNDLDLVFESGGSIGKVLGMSIGKGLGELLYLTAWNGTGLVLALFSLPGLVLIDVIALGDATEAEVDVNTWIARPYCPFGGDEICYVYGRMDDPLATGTVHILLTEDEALSFTEVEQGWGSDHCGALLEDFGRIMAIRNQASASKLYTGDVGGTLTVASTLPFSAQVNPQALVFDWAWGVLYVGAAATDDVMIVVSPEPEFSRWFDLTFDHPTASGIKAIIVL